MSAPHANSLGDKVQKLRQARGLTQQKLATVAEVSLSTVSKIEEGAVTRPSAKVLMKLVKSLDFDLDQLLSDEALPAHLTSQPVSTVEKTHPINQIKFVYSDIGGVLLHTESALLQNLSILYKRPLSKLQALYYQYVPIACTGRLSLEDMQVLFLLKLNIKYQHREKSKLFKHWVDYFEPIVPMQQFLTEIAKEYPVGLLTDTVDGFVERMQKRKILPNLKYRAIVKSSDVNILKPHAQIYEIATKRAGVEPSEILFIDDKKINVEGARAYGWQAVWFNEFNPEASIARIRRQYF